MLWRSYGNLRVATSIKTASKTRDLHRWPPRDLQGAKGEVWYTMKKSFYSLGSPYCDEQYPLYGRPEWARRFGSAEWSDKVIHMEIGRISGPWPPGHPKAGLKQVDLTIILPSPRVGDFVWTWLSDFIVTDSTLSLFEEAGFTGFEVRPVTVEKVKGLSLKRRAEVVIPTLWELEIVGEGGDAAPESGIHLIPGVGKPGAKIYSSFRNGLVVDEANWDGSDFCTVNGYSKHILVTERVRELIMAHGLTNCTLVPSHELEWQGGTRPEDFWAADRAEAQRDLSSLLSDLENPDTLKLKTIYAVGDKKDPRAIGPLIKLFAHKGGSVADSAASAVACIGGPDQKSEQVRTDTFSRLRSLLFDENPQVRSVSASAIGRMGGEEAGKEMKKLLLHPDAWLRQTALFQIGQLSYTPAMEAVRVLTKDVDRSVRNRARKLLKELTAIAQCKDNV